MARLDHVLAVGWRLRPSPTAVGGGRSRAAAADDDDSDDEVEELSQETFKRRTLRLVRTDVVVRTVANCASSSFKKMISTDRRRTRRADRLWRLL